MILNHLSLSTGGAFWPVFLIANVAALIASRAMTTATFSCIKQSMALGCFPRLKIIHTSRKFMGQIYIPVINWFLLVVCLVSVCSISSIDEIGNAYGNSFFLLLLKIFLVSLSILLSFLGGSSMDFEYIAFDTGTDQFGSCFFPIKSKSPEFLCKINI